MVPGVGLPSRGFLRGFLQQGKGKDRNPMNYINRSPATTSQDAVKVELKSGGEMGVG